MKEQIKELRLEIDGLAQLCESLKPIKDGLAMHRALAPFSTTSILEISPERLEEMKKEYRKAYIEVDKATSKNTEEIKEAIKSLKLSKAWIGKVLENLGSENPYGSGYKTVEDIVPETDKAETVCGVMGVDGETPRLEAIDTFMLNGKIMNEYSQMSHIEKVDWLRTEIKRVIDSTTDYSQEVPDIELEQGFAYKYLQEARFWLGFEMGRIRDESK